MNKITSLGLSLVLVMAACGGGGGGGEAEPVASTTSNPNDEQVLSGGPDDNVDESSPANLVTGMWVPSSLAMSEFVRVELADDGVDLVVTEATATYAEIENGAQAALADGQAVLVPATIGARLVESGATLHATLFESTDPEEAVSQLGVWLLSAGGGNENISTSARAPQTRFVATQLAQGNSGDVDVDVVGEVLTIAGEEVDAVVDSKLQTAAFETGATVVRELAIKYGERAGTSIGARTIAKAAGPVASVLDFMYTMYQFEEAASEMIGAESRARTASYETGMTAVAMLSGAHTRLSALEAPVISGDIKPTDTQELVDRMTQSGRRAVAVANQVVAEMEEAGDESNAAQVAQLIEARDATLQKKIIELTLLISDRPPTTGDVFFGELAIGFLAPIVADPTDRAFKEALDILLSDPEPANESKHSNGVLTVQSAGETDIIRHGQFWYETQPGGPGLSEFFPCGSSTGRATLCGSAPDEAGLFTVIVVEFGGALPTGPTERLYQYGIVFDVNGDVSDNYRANASFPYDTWDNTDRWVEVSGGPDGLSLKVTDATTFSTLDTGARVVLDGNVLALFMPQAEIGGGPADPAVQYRATSFWHTGDFGINPPNEFNIDASPPFGEPLALPGEIVRLNGPSGPITAPFDEVLLSETNDAIVAGLAGFTAETPTIEDNSILNEVDECWATGQVFDDPTE